MNVPLRQPSVAQLRDLLETPQLTDLDPLYLASPNQSVQQPVYVTDIQQITSAGPDSLLVLSDEAANNSWKVSVALRYAWERRACAMAIPRDRVRSSMVDLARRLEVSFLTSTQEMLQLSLSIAFHIGVAQAGRVTRLQHFVSKLADARSIAQAASEISAELEHSRVDLTVNNMPIARAGARRDEDARRSVPVSTSFEVERTGRCTVTAETSAAMGTYAEELLKAAIPTLRALLTISTLTSLQDSLPLASIASLTSLRRASTLDPPPPPPEWDAHILQFNHPYRVVCLLADDTTALASAINYFWDPQKSSIPLTRFLDGWLSAIPVPLSQGPESTTEVQDDLRRHLQFPIQIGFSTVLTGVEALAAGIDEAWAAARLAPRKPSSSVVAFDDVHSAMVERFVPPRLASRLLVLNYPELMAHESATELIRTGLSFFNANGSIAHAASELGVHRNTVSHRLDKLNDLGCPLNNPARRVALQLMFNGHIRYLQSTEEI